VKDVGPPIERLTRRLSETPADFLENPVPSGGRSAVNVAAVVSDLVVDLGGKLLSALDAKSFGTRRGARHLTTILVSCWLLHEDWFLEAGRFAEPAKKLLTGKELAEMAQAVAPRLFVTDPDRREELARFCLAQLGLRPAGETETTARDRLTTLSTIERRRVIRETREAQERMRRIQEQMRQKAAREAAPAWGRE
jgi:hypothetical protein